MHSLSALAANASLRPRRRLAATVVSRALLAVPALTEAAVSIGSIATGDSADFGWLTAPTGALLERLFWAANARARRFGHLRAPAVTSGRVARTLAA
jgi:hypothetical protein